LAKHNGIHGGENALKTEEGYEGWASSSSRIDSEEEALARIRKRHEAWEKGHDVVRLEDGTTRVTAWYDEKGNAVPLEKAVIGHGYIRNDAGETLETFIAVPERLAGQPFWFARGQAAGSHPQITEGGKAEAVRSARQRAECMVESDAQYAFAVSVGEAKYDTNEELRDAWRRHMESQRLHLPPEELRRRFIDAHARWKTSPGMLSPADAAFLQAYL
jgi:hypothetical protein